MFAKPSMMEKVVLEKRKFNSGIEGAHLRRNSNLKYIALFPLQYPIVPATIEAEA